MVDAERAAQSAAAQATAEFMSVESEGVPQPQDEEAAQSTPTAGRRRTVRVRRSSPAVRAAALAKHQETLKVNNLLSQAAKSVTQGLFAAAIGKYGAVLEMRPADSTTRGLRAAAYLHVDNYRAALADAKVVISTDSRNSKVRCHPYTQLPTIQCHHIALTVLCMLPSPPARLPNTRPVW